MHTGIVACFFCGLLLLFPGCWGDKVADAPAEQQPTAPVTEDDHMRLRLRMVEEQLSARGIRNEAVLAAMQHVPRHPFVPAAHRHLAYTDYPLPIGHGQTISQPYIVAYMTAAAAIAASDKVLEIGTGSGYQAAVLGALAREVYSIEIIPALAERACQTLGALGYRNIQVKTGNGYWGWPEHAPFNVIVVTAAPEDIPTALVEQLAVHGKMVLPVGRRFQEMVILTKMKDGVLKQRMIPVRFVPMTGKPK